jgi:hypothetical protein
MFVVAAIGVLEVNLIARALVFTQFYEQMFDIEPFLPICMSLFGSTQRNAMRCDILSSGKIIM